MDESGEGHRGAGHGRDDTDRVGLGRVVEDHRPDAGSAAKERVPGTEDTVEEASEDSFPASDAPPFTSASGG
jgi:hypothetical protein